MILGTLQQKARYFSVPSLTKVHGDNMRTKMGKENCSWKSISRVNQLEMLYSYLLQITKSNIVDIIG